LGPLASEDFANSAATATVSYPTSEGAPTLSSSSTIASIRYDAADQSYTLAVDGRTQSFRPSDIDPAQGNEAITVYVRTSGNTTDSLTITRPGTAGLFTYSYVGSAFWQRTVDGTAAISGNFDAITYGVRTPDGAVPRTGQAHFNLSMLGAFSNVNSVSSVAGDGALQVDFGSGQVALNIAIGRNGGITGNMQGSGRLDSGNSLSGTFSSGISGRNFVGSFGGSFFGPAANEVGAAFNGREPSNGLVLAGTFMGRRASATLNSDFNTLAAPQFFTATTNRVAFDKTGDTTAAANVTSGPGSLVIGYDPATSFTGSLFNFFTPDGVIRRRAQADQFGQSGGYAGIQSMPGAGGQSWLQYNLSDFQFLKAGRLNSIVGTRYTFDDFLIGFPAQRDALPTGRAGYLAQLNGTLFNSAEAPLPLTGTTLFSVDFAIGRLTVTGDVRSRNDSRVFGNIDASAQLSSGSSSFSGIWNVAGSASYSGSWNGGFFGPQGQEVGATWQASAEGGNLMAGVLYGKRDDRAIATQTPLAELTAETELRGTAGIVYQTGGSPSYGYTQDHDLSVTYNPTNGTYSFRSATTHNLGAERIDASFSPSERISAKAMRASMFIAVATVTAKPGSPS
jgi:hypothetical protein